MQINTLECGFKGPHQQRPWREREREKEQSDVSMKETLPHGDANGRLIGNEYKNQPAV